MAALIRCLRHSCMKVSHARVLTQVAQAKSSVDTNQSKACLLPNSSTPQNVENKEVLVNEGNPQEQQVRMDDFVCVSEPPGLCAHQTVSQFTHGDTESWDGGQSQRDNCSHPVDFGVKISEQQYKGFALSHHDWQGIQFHMIETPNTSEIYKRLPLEAEDASSLKILLSPSVVQCADESGSIVHATGDRGPNEEPLEKAKKLEHLENVKEFCIEVIPEFFVKTSFISPIHAEDIEYENNYFKKPEYAKGINAYITALMKLRIKSRLRYAHLKAKVMKITVHPEESCVKAHWRVVTLGHIEIFKFWKFNLLDLDKNSNFRWHDGISTLYVNKEGKINKHRIDRIQQLGETVLKEPNILTKVAGVTGVS